MTHAGPNDDSCRSTRESLISSSVGEVTGPVPLTVTVALHLHRMGIVPVRVEHRGKLPIGGAGWQDFRPTPDEVRSWRSCNVGALLGSASRWLTDIDCDCAEAIQLAPFYLPRTWCFGRASTPRAHYLYFSDGAHSKQFRDADEKVMVEIRGETSKGSGAQTVLPPSIHISGELIEWDADVCDGTEEPRAIDARALNTAVAKLARATLFMREGATLEEARALEAAHVPKARTVATTRITPRTSNAADAFDRARHYLAKMPEAVAGQGGHLALFRAAVALVRGFQLSEGSALQLLASEFNPRCQPAWSERELEHKVRQASKSRVPSGYLIDGGRS